MEEEEVERERWVPRQSRMQRGASDSYCGVQLGTTLSPSLFRPNRFVHHPLAALLDLKSEIQKRPQLWAVSYFQTQERQKKR